MFFCLQVFSNIKTTKPEDKANGKCTFSFICNPTKVFHFYQHFTSSFFAQKCYLQHFCTYIRFVFVFLAKGNQQKICSQKLVKLVNFYLTGRQNMKFRAHLNISFAYVFSALHCINCILEVLTLVSMEIFEPRKVLPKCDIMQKMHV